MTRATALFVFAMAGALTGISLTACTVHHHHYHGDSSESVAASPSSDEHDRSYQRDSPQNSQESRGEERAYRERSVAGGSQPARQDLTPEPVAQQPPPPSSETEQREPSPRRALDDCRVRSYQSGWVEAACGPMTILLMTGPASQRGDEMLRGLTLEHGTRLLDANIRYGSTPGGEVALSAGDFQIYDVTLETRQENRELLSFLAFDEEPNLPEIVSAEGLYILAPTTRGKTPMLCYQEGQIDEGRCLDYFDALTSMSIGHLGAPADARVTLAGIELPTPSHCNYNQPQAMVCLLENHLHWSSGPQAEPREALQKTLEFWTDDHDIPNYHNPHETYACRIGDHRGTCHEVAIQGVTDSPSRILYAAHVETADNTYHFQCSVRVEDDLSAPCRAIFGNALSGRWHR